MNAKKFADDYTDSELMAVVAAREIKNGEKVIVGIGLPMIAGFLAMHNHAPKSMLIFEGGYVGGRPPVACTDVGDSALGYLAPYVTSLWRTFSDLQRGFFDLAIIGAAQIDKHGNVNSTALFGKGNYRRPGVRLPGSGGANDMASSAKRLLVMTRLERKRFVQKVDYLTSPGYLRGPGAREKAGLLGKGPVGVITDKAVFGFDEETKEMYLSGIFPGVDLAEIRKKVGFKLDLSSEIDVVQPPTREEVKFIRDFDPADFILRRRFALYDFDFASWAKVTRCKIKK